jgi:ABC-type nitrate/sulfonate/bicarbonate transport system permease component
MRPHANGSGRVHEIAHSAVASTQMSRFPHRMSALAAHSSYGATRRSVLSVIGVAAFLLVWQGVLLFGFVAERDLPSPGDVLTALTSEVQTSTFWYAIGDTVLTTAIGVGIAVAIGVALGVLVGSYYIIWRGLRPFLEFWRSVPPIAMIPFALLEWGQTTKAAVFLVAFGCVWIMLIQATFGVHEIEMLGRETMKAFGVERRDRIRFLVVPSICPSLATGLRLSASMGLVLAVGTEYLAGAPGLGDLIGISAASANYPLMYASIVTAGLFGLLAQLVLAALERKLIYWRPAGPAGMHP